MGVSQFPAAPTDSVASYRVRSFATELLFDDRVFAVALDDGRFLRIPWRWFPRLDAATPGQRNAFCISASGESAHCDDLDEDIGVAGVLRRQLSRIHNQPRGQRCRHSVPARGAAGQKKPAARRCSDYSVLATRDLKTGQRGAGGRPAARPCSARTGSATVQAIFLRPSNPDNSTYQWLRLMVHRRGDNGCYRDWHPTFESSPDVARATNYAMSN